MDLEGLSVICSGLGFAQEGEDGITGYTKSEFCLDNLKDLQRFLRRDDPQTRDVFMQVCKWNTASIDLVPIIECYQSDRNLVINAVKILVFLTMPIDLASDNISQQIEHLWSLKAAVARNDTIAVIVSLLEDPLEHLERDAFTEDDWKLVQLVLTLFRNILAIQDISLQQKASGSATQFLSLRDRFLELMFHENVMDLILVLTQHVGSSHGYLRQDSMLLLEIFHYIFFGQDPGLIAKESQKASKVDGDVKTSLNSLRSIMEEEEQKRLIRLRNLDRHSQFRGTFTRLGVDGSKTLFKGNPAFASGDSLLKVHKIQRGPLKRMAWDHGNLSLPKGSVLELLRDFLNQFLSGGYNVLMQSIRMDIEKEHHGIQNSDVVVFFQVAHFVTSFQHHKFSISKLNIESTTEVSSVSKNADNTLFHGDICGPVAATMNEAMFLLVISKWHYAFDSLKETNDYKSLSAAGSLMKEMIRMLDLVLKLLPEDSREPQTTRILLYKIFYDQTDQGMTQFLMNLLRSFDTQKQPKSDLADLVEMTHVVLRLMDKLQARGSLRVSRKSRKSRKKKQLEKNETELEKSVEEKKTVEVNDSAQNADDPNLEIGNVIEQPEVNIDGDSLTEDFKNSSLKGKEKVASGEEGTEMPFLNSCNLGDDLVESDDKKFSNCPNDLANDSSNDDEPNTMSEVDFDVTRLVSTLANNTVIQNLCWLLKFYKSNSACTNHYIVSILRRICDDLELSPMLYQLSLLTTFYDILSDKKSSNCKEYANIVSFLTSLVRQLMKKMKSQPLLFVEILFWKTRKECHYINSESLLIELGNLKKGNRGWESVPGDDGEIGLPVGNGGLTRRSIADSLGEDEADFVFSHDLNYHREGSSSDGNHRISGDDTCDVVDLLNDGHSLEHEAQRASKRKKTLGFDQVQESKIKDLYEKYKENKRCSRLIAEALDPDGKVSPLQVSSKLKQLGLKVCSKRQVRRGDDPSLGRDDEVGTEDGGISNTTDVPITSNNSGISSSPGRSLHPRKRIRAFSNEQELRIKDLFEQFKNHKRCSYLIASALDSDNTYTAAQVSRKLKQLGLHVPRNKRLFETSSHSVQDDENVLVASENKQQTSEDETLSTFRKRRKSTSNIKLSSKKASLTNASFPEDDSDDEILSTILKKSGKRTPKVTDDKVISVEETKIADHLENAIKSDGFVTDNERNPIMVGVAAAVDLAHLNDNLEDELVDLDGGKSAKANDSAEDVDISAKAHSPYHELEDSGDDAELVMAKSIGLRRKLKVVIDFDDDNE